MKNSDSKDVNKNSSMLLEHKKKSSNKITQF